MMSGIGDSASTSFITLYCHALETLSENPIISDPKSVEITTELNKTLSCSDHPLDIFCPEGNRDNELCIQRWTNGAALTLMKRNWGGSEY